MPSSARPWIQTERRGGRSAQSGGRTPGGRPRDQRRPYLATVLWIRIGFNEYPDPDLAFYVNADLDPDQVPDPNQDPLVLITKY